MKQIASFATVMLLCAMCAAPLRAEYAVLERYSIGTGGDLDDGDGEVSAFIQDDRFGAGTAQASMFLDTAPGERLLHLRVWRHVPADTIVFALLVFRVEVRAFDAAGEPVFSRNLPYFAFGDSASGNWLRKLRLPRAAARVEVSFLGNYE